jgi:chemotaxis protein methyltransferase CheR
MPADARVMTTSTPAGPPGPAPDYLRFCDGIRRVCGIDLGQYRPAQMERRLRAFAERAGHPDLDAYLTHIRADMAARGEFLDRMTINVSELFRNPERFAELERVHLPALRSAGRGLRVWSAACSYGAESYSLAILLHELDRGVRHEVRASDIDRTVLARAREGAFSETDMRNVTAARRARWFTDAPGGGAVAGDRLRGMVRFTRVDLLNDRYPTGQDLILCRNVVIYLTEGAKRLVHARLREALRPGGILMVGSTESIPEPEANGWEKAGTFFYRRAA